MSMTILETPASPKVEAPTSLDWDRAQLDWLLATIEHSGKPAPGTWTMDNRVVLCCTSSCSCGGGGKKVK